MKLRCTFCYKEFDAAELDALNVGATLDIICPLCEAKFTIRITEVITLEDRTSEAKAKGLTGKWFKQVKKRRPIILTGYAKGYYK